MAYIRQSVEQSVTDEHGTIKTKRVNRVISHGEEPPYVKLYLKDLMYMSDMPKGYSALVYALLKRVSYAGDEDGMCVTLVPRTKKAICQELGWEKTSSLDNALQRLLKGRILFRVDRGIYRMNPYLFGKGEWQDVDRIRLEVSYSLEGKTFAAVCDYKEQDQPQDTSSKTGVDAYPDDLPGQMELSDFVGKEDPGYAAEA